MNVTIDGAAGPNAETRSARVTDWGSTSTTYASTYRAMLRVAYTITGSHAAAEDAVHDAFCAVGPKIATLDDPVPYLRVAVVNRCRSMHRHASKAPPPTPPDAVGLDAGLVDFSDALATLPFAQRTAIVMRYLCDLPDEEIATVLQCRRSTVRSHVRRGLEHLRQELS